MEKKSWLKKQLMKKDEEEKKSYRLLGKFKDRIIDLFKEEDKAF